MPYHREAAQSFIPVILRQALRGAGDGDRARAILARRNAAWAPAQPRSGGPNQEFSASRSPWSVPSPTHATCPSGRINTAVGAATAPSTGNSHAPPYRASTRFHPIHPRSSDVEDAGLTQTEQYRPRLVHLDQLEHGLAQGLHSFVAAVEGRLRHGGLLHAVRPLG